MDGKNFAWLFLLVLNALVVLSPQLDLALATYRPGIDVTMLVFPALLITYFLYRWLPPEVFNPQY